MTVGYFLATARFGVTDLKISYQNPLNAYTLFNWSNHDNVCKFSYLSGKEYFFVFFRKEKAGSDQAPIVVEYASPAHLAKGNIESVRATPMISQVFAIANVK